jgi:ABC-2 type transport system ATP-binding protein
MTFGLDQVSVRFGGRTVLNAVSLPVRPSEITVVVGGDGAGKTTCLRTLVGLVHPDDGEVRRPGKERIGYVPATTGLYEDLTVEENLAFSAHAYAIPRAEYQQRTEELLARNGLTNARQRRGGELSGGMKRKLAVGLALLHVPELLVLDEPTTGVDPVSRVELWRLISQAAVAGAAVVVATTYVNEAARATSVVLLESGRVIATGSPEEILASIPGTLGRTRGGSQPTERSWRRGLEWRVWAPSGGLPAGVESATPDLEDAVVVASLADDLAGSPQ